jgi:hypothetical protein
LSFGLSVGNGVVSTTHHGFYVELCGCECGSMLATLFQYTVPVFLVDLNYGFKSSFSEQTIGYQAVANRRRWNVQ